MTGNREQFFLEVMSGRRRGAGAGLLRATMRVGEIPYTLATSARNALYRTGALRAHRVDRPVICVGNITTGGTGKTPVVRWLAQRLLADGISPAVLLRGYKSSTSGPADEHLLHMKLLPPAIPVRSNSDRVAGARELLTDFPETRAIVLDDGFQHRRLYRDFDLVLIDASNAFGGGHLLPRGLLRERPAGLSRASAILITHVESADAAEVSRVESEIRAYAPAAPIYRSRHILGGNAALQHSVFAFSGIGNPAAFEAELARNATVLGARRFADHHQYTAAEVEQLRAAADAAGAATLVTTEKDWVKVEPLLRAGGPGTPIVALPLAIEFESDHEARLYQQIRAASVPH